MPDRFDPIIWPLVAEAALSSANIGERYPRRIAPLASTMRRTSRGSMARGATPWRAASAARIPAAWPIMAQVGMTRAEDKAC